MERFWRIVRAIDEIEGAEDEDQALGMIRLVPGWRAEKIEPKDTGPTKYRVWAGSRSLASIPWAVVPRATATFRNLSGVELMILLKNDWVRDAREHLKRLSEESAKKIEREIGNIDEKSQD